MAAPVTSIEIRYETEHYAVRPLFATDASARICAWLADPQTARMLNTPARALSLDELRNYFAAHDGIKTHLLGMFDKASGSQLGIWAIYIDWAHREFLLNVVVGERGPGGAGVRLETQRPLLSILFEDQDLLTLRASVLARNEKIERRFEANRIAPEHTSYKGSVHEAAPEEIHHYSLARDQWRQLRQARLEREGLESERVRKAS